MLFVYHNNNKFSTKTAMANNQKADPGHMIIKNDITGPFL